MLTATGSPSHRLGNWMLRQALEAEVLAGLGACRAPTHGQPGGAAFGAGGFEQGGEAVGLAAQLTLGRVTQRQAQRWPWRWRSRPPRPAVRSA